MKLIDDVMSLNYDDDPDEEMILLCFSDNQEKVSDILKLSLSFQTHKKFAYYGVKLK